MKTYKIKIDGKEYEVLGCPFCGEAPIAEEIQGYIQCKNIKCHAMPKISICFLATEARHLELIEEAINKRWNKRAN